MNRGEIAFSVRLHSRKPLRRGVRNFMRPPERLNYVDAIVTAYANASGAPVLIGDEDLRRATRREATWIQSLRREVASNSSNFERVTLNP